jgi:hypothetical protein
MGTRCNPTCLSFLRWPPYGQVDIRNSNTQWLAFQCPFTAVENLTTIHKPAQCIVPVMQERVEGKFDRMTEVFPRPSDHLLEGASAIGTSQERQFAGVRQHSGRPITVYLWNIGSQFVLKKNKF